MTERNLGQRTHRGGQAEQAQRCESGTSLIAQRLAADADAAEPFDRINRLAAGALGVPMAFVAFFEKDRLCIKVGLSVGKIDIPQGRWPFLDKLAHHAHPVVADLAKLPAIPCPNGHALSKARTIAAAALRGPEGRLIGALCVLDTRARRFNPQKLRILTDLAGMVEQELSRSATASPGKKRPPVSVRPAEPGVDRLIYVTRATQSASDAILVTDAASGSRYANRSFVNLTGYTADEISLLGGFAKLYVDEKTSLDGLNDVVTGRHWAREMQIQTKSGAVIDVWVRLDPICDDYGNVVGRVTVITDISESRRTQAALLESEARLRSLVQSIDDIVFEFDSDGRILHVWTEDESLLKAPKAIMTGRLISDILGADFAEPYVRRIREVMATGRPEHFEYPLDVIAGSRWFLGRITPIYSGDGSCRSVCMLARDITARKQGERELFEAERKYRAIFENAVEGIFQSTESGTLLSVNPALARIYGYDSTQQMIDEVNDIGAQIYVDPARRNEVLEIIRSQGHVSSLESETRRRDGSIVWISENVRTVRDPEGEVVYYEGTVQDITERKHAERELREAEGRYRSIFENAAEGIYQCTPDGRFISVNPALARIYGYDSPDHLLAEVANIASQLLIDPAIFAREIDAILRFGYSHLPEVEVRRRDGTRVWVSSYARAAFGDDGQPLYFEGTVQDISESRQIRRELREHQKFLRSVIDTDPNLIFVKDRSGRFVLVNQATAEIYGTTVEDLVGKSDADFNANPEEVEQFVRDDCAVMDKLEERFISEEKVTDSQGKVRWLQTVKRPLFSPDGAANQILGIATDITARKCAEDALKQKEELFRLMIENSSDVITVLDPDGTVRYGSPSLERVLGYAPDELIGRNLFDYIHPEDRAKAHGVLLEGLSQRGKPVAFDIRLRHKNGSWRFVESTGSNQIDTRGVEGIVLNSRDITERRLAEQELDFLAYHDILTELPNRLLFTEHLEIAIESAADEGHMAAVLFLDLDRFKVINDTLGHTLGDELLRSVAARLSGTLQESDVVSRWGGDEFTILLPQVTDTQEVVRATQRIIAALSAPFELQDSEYYITATVGISVYPSCGQDAETLIRNADTAMYRAKELGKNYYQLFMPSMNVGAIKKLALEQSLRKAIEREEFTLHFQPQIEAEVREIVGVEALLRWQHPELGLVPPGDFIPLAEETGLIVPLGEWVLRTACRQAIEWDAAGYAPLRIAVNISAYQFRRSDLVPTIAAILAETGLAPDRLELELTESVLIESEQRNIETLSELSAMGIRLAIDDFGTGYSSFIYLKRYPITCIKIDRAFVRDVTVDPNDAAITQSLIAMAQNLKMGVVAEGVETREQCAFLAGHGCTLMQGYYFSAPLPADALVSFLEKRSVQVLKAA